MKKILAILLTMVLVFTTSAIAFGETRGDWQKAEQGVSYSTSNAIERVVSKEYTPQPLKLNNNQIYAYDYSGNGHKITSACSLTFTDTTASTAYALVGNGIKKATTSKKSVCTVKLYTTSKAIVNGRTQKAVVITAKKKGTAKITLQDSNGECFTFNVKVKKAPKSEITSITLSPDGTASKAVTVSGAKKAVTTSSTICKATVKSGKVTIKGYAPGTAVVYVKNKNGKVIEDIVVTVNDLDLSYSTNVQVPQYQEHFKNNKIPNVLRTITHVEFNSIGGSECVSGTNYKNGKATGAQAFAYNVGTVFTPINVTAYMKIDYYVNGKTVTYFQKTGSYSIGSGSSYSERKN